MSKSRMLNVIVQGCDAHTEIAIEASEVERNFLIRLARLVNTASTYGCMPSVEISDDNGEAIEL